MLRGQGEQSNPRGTWMGAYCRAWRSWSYGRLLTGCTRSPTRVLHLQSPRSNQGAQMMMAAGSVLDDETGVETQLSYHQVTKHSFLRYARGPHGLDWANQPNPFRRYAGTKILRLQHLQPSPSPSPEDNGDVLYPMVGTGNLSAQPITSLTLSQLLYDSLALSAWKSVGTSTWSLRVNPSSGNLHPTEAYVIGGAIPGFSDSPFVAHYAPKEHALEVRAEISQELWQELSEGLPEGSILVGLSSIYWREAWKYGERAFRYCNHDVGHAIGALVVAGANLGWNAQLLDGYGTLEISHLLGLAHGESLCTPRNSALGSERGVFPDLEREHADCILALFPWSQGSALDCNRELPVLNPDVLVSHFSGLKFSGTPNSLSKEHVRWERIYAAGLASHKPSKRASIASLGSRPVPESLVNDKLYEGYSARQVVRRRRSAVDMDGKYGMKRDVFYQILVKASVATPKMFPYGVLPWEPEIHCAVFVHRVVDLPQGIYFLMRNSAHESSLKNAFSSKFHWEKAPGCPPDLPLYRLLSGDCRTLAARLSCNQEIAGNSFFSLGMIARFEPVLRENGGWMYPRLFWEAGLLGQVLYLEATALGVAATGIGCYFDDAVHEVLGLGDKEYQSLYHFTIGVPIVDSRIMSLPAYPGPAEDA